MLAVNSYRKVQLKEISNSSRTIRSGRGTQRSRAVPERHGGRDCSPVPILHAHFWDFLVWSCGPLPLAAANRSLRYLAVEIVSTRFGFSDAPRRSQGETLG